MKWWMNLVIWFVCLSLAAGLVALGGDLHSVRPAVLTGMWMTMVMFGLFCPYINNLIRQIPFENGGAGVHDDPDELRHCLDTDACKQEWKRRIDELALQNIPESGLLSWYRETFLALWDIVDPHEAENLSQEPISEIIRCGNASRYFSLRRFCRRLGR